MRDTTPQVWDLVGGAPPRGLRARTRWFNKLAAAVETVGRMGQVSAPAEVLAASDLDATKRRRRQKLTYVLTIAVALLGIAIFPLIICIPALRGPLGLLVLGAPFAALVVTGILVEESIPAATAPLEPLEIGLPQLGPMRSKYLGLVNFLIEDLQALQAAADVEDEDDFASLAWSAAEDLALNERIPDCQEYLGVIARLAELREEAHAALVSKRTLSGAHVEELGTLRETLPNPGRLREDRPARQPLGLPRLR